MKKVMIVLIVAMMGLVIMSSALKLREEEKIKIQTVINEEMNVAMVSEDNENQDTNKTVLELQENSSEKYVEEVVLEANWGDGEGEFGISKETCPIEGPGPFIIDKYNNFYINDIGNQSIKKFSAKGKFIQNIIDGQMVTYFTIKTDTLIAIGYKNMNNLEIYLTKINKNSGKIIDQTKIKRNEKNIIENSLKNAFENLNSKKIKSIIEKKQKGLSEIYLGRDKKNNIYYGIDKIYKFSSAGEFLTVVQLPFEDYIGEYRSGIIQINTEGDIYYLYPTGQIIEEDFKINFIPGKIQLIKYRLQK